MRDKKGTILIFTTWILFVLTILSITVASRASSQLNLVRYEIEAIKSTSFAKAAVHKALIELRKDKDEGVVYSLKEDLNHTKTLILEGKEVIYTINDEERRLNLNSITKEILIRLSPDNITSEIADEIIEYKNNKANYSFEVLDELFLIKEISGDEIFQIFQDIKDYVSVYRGSDSEININTADRKVLEAIGMEAGDIILHRKGQDGEEGTEDDNVFKEIREVTDVTGLLAPEVQQWIGFSSQFFRIKIEIKHSRNRSTGVEAVFDRDQGKILSWKEN